jgi:hypothetical protein
VQPEESRYANCTIPAPNIVLKVIVPKFTRSLTAVEEMWVSGGTDMGRFATGFEKCKKGKKEMESEGKTRLLSQDSYSCIVIGML